MRAVIAICQTYYEYRKIYKLLCVKSNAHARTIKVLMSAFWKIDSKLPSMWQARSDQPAPSECDQTQPSYCKLPQMIQAPAQTLLPQRPAVLHLQSWRKLMSHWWWCMVTLMQLLTCSKSEKVTASKIEKLAWNSQIMIAFYLWYLCFFSIIFSSGCSLTNIDFEVRLKGFVDFTWSCSCSLEGCDSLV